MAYDERGSGSVEAASLSQSKTVARQLWPFWAHGQAATGHPGLVFKGQPICVRNTNQNCCIPAAPIEISGATDMAQLRLIIGVFPRQLPDGFFFSYKHCLSVGCPFLLQAPTIARHVIRRRRLYIRRCACLPWPKNCFHSYPICR